jgi:hypothetical protein
MYVFYFLTSPPRDYALQNVSTFFKNVGFLSVFSSTFFKSLQHFFKMLDNIFGVPTYYNISVFKLFQHFFLFLLHPPPSRRLIGQPASWRVASHRAAAMARRQTLRGRTSGQPSAARDAEAAPGHQRARPHGRARGSTLAARLEEEEGCC